MFQVVASNKFLKDLKFLKKRSVADFKLLQDFVNHDLKDAAKDVRIHKEGKVKLQTFDEFLNELDFV